MTKSRCGSAFPHAAPVNSSRDPASSRRGGSPHRRMWLLKLHNCSRGDRLHRSSHSARQVLQPLKHFATQIRFRSATLACAKRFAWHCSTLLLILLVLRAVRQQWLDNMEPEPECVKCRCECQLSESLDAPENLNGPIKRGDSSAALPNAGAGALSAPSASWQTALNAVVPCCVVLR